MKLKPFRDYESWDRELYLGWMLAGKLAEWLGMEVGINETGEILRLVIELPSGQVVQDIPKSFAKGNWKSFDLDKIEDYDEPKVTQAILDCLNGYLLNKHMLVIPEKKEETE